MLENEKRINEKGDLVAFADVSFESVMAQGLQKTILALAETNDVLKTMPEYDRNRTLHVLFDNAVFCIDKDFENMADNKRSLSDKDIEDVARIGFDMLHRSNNKAESVDKSFYCRKCGEAGMLLEGTTLKCPMCGGNKRGVHGTEFKCVARVVYDCGCATSVDGNGNTVYEDRWCSGFLLDENSRISFACPHRNFEEGGHGCLNTQMYPDAIKKVVPAATPAKEYVHGIKLIQWMFVEYGLEIPGTSFQILKKYLEYEKGEKHD